MRTGCRLIAVLFLFLASFPPSARSQGFPAGTLIDTPDGRRPIEAVRPGDVVIAIRPDGRAVTVRVLSCDADSSQLVLLRTRHGQLTTTDDHPLRFATGEFLPATEIYPGERLSIRRKGRLRRTTVREVRFLDDAADVYSLGVEEPHTFIADGFVVHNREGERHDREQRRRCCRLNAAAR